MLTLGIETSCDDTGVAILDDAHIRSELLSSQIKDHARFGGVVPEFAARRHLENLLPLVRAALDEVGVTGRDLDLIAVTKGPGLMGSLMVGVQTAKALGQVWNVPVIGVNHLEGHLFAPIVDLVTIAPDSVARSDFNFNTITVPNVEDALDWPVLSLIVSGGHTEIVKFNAPGDYTLLGTTRDDAAGEAYDKGARILGLPYPGGPEIDRRARTGNAHAFDFPIPLKNTKQVEFSFSGLKTALLWQVKNLGLDAINNISGEACDANDAQASMICDLCASFQRAVTEALISKVALAVKQTGIRTVMVSGGVAANSALREALTAGGVTNARAKPKWRAYLPKISRCTDNAVMIALAGRSAWSRGERSPIDLSPDPSLDL